MVAVHAKAALLQFTVMGFLLSMTGSTSDLLPMNVIAVREESIAKGHDDFVLSIVTPYAAFTGRIGECPG